MMQDTSSPLWQRILGPVGAFFLGAVLLVAAWAKVLDPSAFAEQIRLEGLDFLLPAAAVAVIALALEVGLGTALVLGLRRLWILIPSALLVLFFLWLTGRNYWLTANGLREEDAACGCFGNLVERTPAEAFWQDLLLLVPPLLLAFLAYRHSGRRWLKARVAVVALLTVGALLLAWKAPELPLDNLATRLKPGVDPAQLCTGQDSQRVCMTAFAPELLEGYHLVLMADLEDPELAAAIPAINEYILDAAGPRLVMLAATTPEQLRAFYWQQGPAFDIREVPPGLLKPLYRRLPRSFTVRDGRVEETFSSLPPLDRFTRGATPQPQETP